MTISTREDGKRCEKEPEQKNENGRKKKTASTQALLNGKRSTQRINVFILHFILILELTIYTKDVVFQGGRGGRVGVSWTYHMCPLGACRETWLLYWKAGCSLDNTGSCVHRDRHIQEGILKGQMSCRKENFVFQKKYIMCRPGAPPLQGTV